MKQIVTLGFQDFNSMTNGIDAAMSSSKGGQRRSDLAISFSQNMLFDGLVHDASLGFSDWGRPKDHQRKIVFPLMPQAIRLCGRKNGLQSLLNCRRLSTSHIESNDAWHGSHHWMYGRILSAATLGSILTAMAITEPSPMVDLALNVVIPLHCHMGFNEVITDYVPKYKFPKIYPVAKGAAMAGTALTMYGLFQYNTKDVGITEGFRSIWRASSQID